MILIIGDYQMKPNTMKKLFIICNYSVLLRNPQFLHKVEKWKRAEKISEMSIYKKRKKWYAEEKEWW